MSVSWRLELRRSRGHPKPCPCVCLLTFRGNSTVSFDHNTRDSCPEVVNSNNHRKVCLVKLLSCSTGTDVVANILNPKLKDIRIYERTEYATFWLNVSHICAKWKSKQLVCEDQDLSMSQQTVKHFAKLCSKWALEQIFRS